MRPVRRPSSRISPPVSLSTSAPDAATQAADKDRTPGAVTKSPPRANLRAACTVNRPKARRIESSSMNVLSKESHQPAAAKRLSGSGRGALESGVLVGR